MQHYETSPQNGLFSGFLRALGPRHFWQKAVNCMEKEKSSRGARKPYSSSAFNGRTVHLELGFQRHFPHSHLSSPPGLFFIASCFATAKYRGSQQRQQHQERKHLVLLNKDLLLLKRERKYCPNGSRWEGQDLCPSWQVLQGTVSHPTLPNSPKQFDGTTFLFPSSAKILNTCKL